MSITIRVVGLPITGRASNVADARKKALAFSRDHPDRWVEARLTTGDLVHLIEPRSIVDSIDNEEIETVVLPDQEPMF